MLTPALTVLFFISLLVLLAKTGLGTVLVVGLGTAVVLLLVLYVAVKALPEDDGRS